MRIIASSEWVNCFSIGAGPILLDEVEEEAVDDAKDIGEDGFIRYDNCVSSTHKQR